jgi:DNA-binding response OmpR family regulator/GGDEF domain-containing protein
MKILLADTSRSFVSELAQCFQKQGYIVEPTDDGQTAQHLVDSFQYDLIFLNQCLPQVHGLSLCQKLRTFQSNTTSINQRTPIVIIANHKDSDHVDQKVKALDSGADDYLVKPIALNELMAKVRVLLRWQNSCRSPLLKWGGITLDTVNCTVDFHRKRLTLCRKEYDLLHLFLRNPYRVLSQDTLMDSLWGLQDIPTESTVRTHIKKLRRKLKDAGAGDIIETVYGVGYRLRAPKTDEVVTPTERGTWVHSLRSDDVVVSSGKSSPTVSQVTPIARSRTNERSRILTYPEFIQKFNQLQKTAIDHDFSLTLVSLSIKDFQYFNQLYGEHTQKQVIARISKLLQYVFRSNDLIGLHKDGGFLLGLSKIPEAYVEKRISNFLEIVQYFPFASATGKSFHVCLIAEVYNPHHNEIMPPIPNYGT